MVATLFVISCGHRVCRIRYKNYYDPYKATITPTTTHCLRKMASNQTNHFQSLNLSVEEFIDGQENKNTKKKTKRYVAVFHEFLVLKGGTRQMN